MNAELEVLALKTNYSVDRILCLGSKLILLQCTHSIVLAMGIKGGNSCKALETMPAMLWSI